MSQNNEMQAATVDSHMNFTLIAGVIAIAIVAGGILWVPKGEPLDTQTLSLDAIGCVATTPKGQPLKQALADGLKTIPKGTTFTAQCFGRKS
ncbi:hypothetical protein VQ574_21020 (plasmid) [Stutzerimonas frequens]|uniref:hypothetical protein n=1 Tax=Stutzerimonas frequens TaxID=2968969 RepID=UPI002DBBA2ED|nr:hypothetical protein [Stutzerimonas frequens]WRW29421.1 hypothetical protein VQ574_21020 [Stutzerimonas frequens]